MLETHYLPRGSGTVKAGRIAVFVVGAVLALVGIIGLARDVSIVATDPVSCGNGFSADYTAVDSQAASYAYAGMNSFDERTLRDECNDALSDRRVWAWPVTGLGALLTGGAVLAGVLGARSRRVEEPAVGGDQAREPEAH